MTNGWLVPRALLSAIEAAINGAFAGSPCDDATRASIRNDLLLYFDKHPDVPPFVRVKTGTEDPAP